MKFIIRSSGNKIRQWIYATSSKYYQTVKFTFHKVYSEFGQHTGALYLFVHLLATVQCEIPVVFNGYLAAANHSLGLADKVEHRCVIVEVWYEYVISSADVRFVNRLTCVTYIPKDYFTLKVSRVVAGEYTVTGAYPNNA